MQNKGQAQSRQERNASHTTAPALTASVNMQAMERKRAERKAAALTKLQERQWNSEMPARVSRGHHGHVSAGNSASAPDDQVPCAELVCVCGGDPVCRPQTPPLPGDTGLCPPAAISLRVLTEEILIHNYSLSFKVTRRKIKLTGAMGRVLPYFTNSKTFRNQRQHKHEKKSLLPISYASGSICSPLLLIRVYPIFKAFESSNVMPIAGWHITSLLFLFAENPVFTEGAMEKVYRKLSF